MSETVPDENGLAATFSGGPVYSLEEYVKKLDKSIDVSVAFTVLYRTFVIHGGE